MKRKTAAERAWEKCLVWHERHRYTDKSDGGIKKLMRRDFLSGYHAGAKLPSAKVLHEEMRDGGGVYHNHAEQALAAIRRLRRKA